MNPGSGQLGFVCMGPQPSSSHCYTAFITPISHPVSYVWFYDSTHRARCEQHPLWLAWYTVITKTDRNVHLYYKTLCVTASPKWINISPFLIQLIPGVHVTMAQEFMFIWDKKPFLHSWRLAQIFSTDTGEITRVCLKLRDCRMVSGETNISILSNFKDIMFPCVYDLRADSPK